MGLFDLFRKNKAPQITMVKASLVTPETFRKEAQETVSTAKEIFEAKLDFTAESIKTLDKMIEEGWKTPMGEKEAYELSMSILSLGSYLGETIIKNLGGKWQVDIAEKNPVEKMLSAKIIDLGKIAEIYPFGKTFKRFVSGKEDSLDFYYISLERINKN